MGERNIPSEPLRWGFAPDPTGAIRPWTRTSDALDRWSMNCAMRSSSNRPNQDWQREIDLYGLAIGLLEELRIAQFFITVQSHALQGGNV
jgi:hypothetical protein